MVKDFIILIRNQLKQQSNIIQIAYPFSFNKIHTLIILIIAYEMMVI